MGFGIQDLTPIGAAVDTVVNPVLQHLQNVKNRKFTREMYNRQRQDALSDWATQNAYNSPAAQMERFKQAGLNPHLIYGQSNEGATVRSSSVTGGQGEAPRVNASQGLMAMYSIKQTQLQTENLREVNENLRVDRDLKKANIASIIARTDLTQTQKQNLLFELGIKSDLRDTTLEGARLKVESQKSSIALAWREDLRRNLLTQMSLEEKAQRIASLVKGREKTDADIDKIRKQIWLMEKDGTIKDYEIAYRKAGGNPNDPTLIKLWDGILKRLGLGNTIDIPKMLGGLRFESPRGQRVGSYNGRRRTGGFTATDSN